MDKLMAMQVFASVVDCGSQSAAADKLGLSRPVVSRYLAELEAWMGVRLLHRTTRKLSLTAAGAQSLARCRQLLEQVDDMQAALAAPDNAPRGLLRITASASFVQAQLAQVVADFVRLHPAVAVDLVLQDKAVNLVEQGIDLALRITNELDPNLIARELTICRSVLCASPAYLQQHGRPLSVQELGQRNCLTHSYFGKSVWQFDVPGKAAESTEAVWTQEAVAVSGNLSANDATALMQMALADAGIALLPTFLAQPLLQSGRLCALLPSAVPPSLKIYAVFASRKHMSPALRALLDFLLQRFPAEPQWDRV